MKENGAMHAFVFRPNAALPQQPNKEEPQISQDFTEDNFLYFCEIS